MNGDGGRTDLNGFIMVGTTALIVTVFVSMVSLVWGMGTRPPVAGMPAHEFSLPNLSGQAQSLSQYRGKIVLLNFWAAWCKPCTTEMPAMQAVYERFQDRDFVVLAINEFEDTHKVVEHIRKHGHTFPVLLDQDNRVANQYGVFGLPVSVFIDETGRIGEYMKGGLLTEQMIQETVNRIRIPPTEHRIAALH
jgi:peroxiredoxin